MAPRWLTPVSKFDDRPPLSRQAEIFARMGADIPDTTLVDWVRTGPGGIDPSGGRIEGLNARSAGHGRAMKTLHPVIERIEADGEPSGRHWFKTDGERL